jgi:hypothetical protein
MVTHWIIRKATPRRWLLLYVTGEDISERLMSHYHSRKAAVWVAERMADVGDTIQVEK